MATIADRQIVLVKPGAVTGKDSFGSPVVGEPARMSVWARRNDRGGSERLTADTFVQDSQSRYDILTAALPREVETNWHIEENGKVFDIVAVAEAAGGLPGNVTWLYCRRRT